MTASVYVVCMPRVNIYLTDDLARRAREAGLNVSRIAQEAIERELKARAFRTWLDEVRANPPLRGVRHEQVIAALDDVRGESGDEFPPGYDMSDR